LIDNKTTDLTESGKNWSSYRNYLSTWDNYASKEQNNVKDVLKEITSHKNFDRFFEMQQINEFDKYLTQNNKK
jgi:hypothetical protein